MIEITSLSKSYNKGAVKAVDDSNARVTMEHAGIKGSLTFYFNEKGEPIRALVPRYRDINDKEPTDWEAKITEFTTLLYKSSAPKFQNSYLLLPVFLDRRRRLSQPLLFSAQQNQA